MTASEPLTITVHRAPGHTVLRLDGPCDYETAPDLREAADQVLATEPVPQCLTLDCTGVDDWDSSALSALIWIKRCVDADQVRLHLVGIDDHQLSVLRITGLSMLFEEALADTCQGDRHEAAAAHQVADS
ncbi:STAS domain-containing protein [Streptacidiphilus sp. N1-12]|uniref:STAS domain-containing protein n=1 Tax=Streptacidiphilus alkalitolerans TaxID=3342712 RepID=A0ABV6W8S8_9ACTN